MNDIFECDSAEQCQAELAALEMAANSGDGQAAFELSIVYSPHSMLPERMKRELGASDEKRLHYEQLAVANSQREVEDETIDPLRRANAMRLMAMFYQTGMAGIAPDTQQCIAWNERALAAENTFAANDLYTIYSEPESKEHRPADAARVLKILEEHDCRVVELREEDA